MTTREKSIKLLEDEVSGCHGESERRAVAQFVLDSLPEHDDESSITASDICEYLAEAAKTLKADLDKLADQEGRP